MIRRTIFIGSLFLSLFVVTLCAAELPASQIPWAEGCKLNWTDFLCPPPVDAMQRIDVAAIHMTVQWNATYTVRSQLGTTTWIGTVDSLTVTNTMDSGRSWVIRSRASTEALRHEQSHFDLNEVYRRKLEITLCCLECQGASGQETQTRLDELLHTTASDLLDRLSAVQDRYDHETAHGTDPSAQANWDRQIAAWMLDPRSAP